MLDTIKCPGSPTPQIQTQNIWAKPLQSRLLASTPGNSHRWTTSGNPESSQSLTRLTKKKEVSTEKLVNVRGFRVTFMGKTLKVWMKCHLFQETLSIMTLIFATISILMVDILNLLNLSSMSIIFLSLSFIYSSG